MTKNANIFYHEKFTSQMIDSDIYYISFHKDSFLEIDDIKDSFKTYKTFGDNKPLKVLMEFGKYVSTNLEGRTYTQQNTIPAIAEAIVLTSLPLKLLYSFHLKKRILKHPIKTFTSKSKALIWLKTI